MKRALLLHGTEGSPGQNWFPWLATQLKNRGYEVWAPQLPSADRPAARLWTDFLMTNALGNWVWDADTLIVGHSAGAVEIEALVQELPVPAVREDAEPVVVAGLCVLVAPFTPQIAADAEWAFLSAMFETPFDDDVIRARAKQFVIIHADNDPYIPLDQPREIADRLGAKLRIIPGKQHFSAQIEPPVRELPEILPYLEV